MRSVVATVLAGLVVGVRTFAQGPDIVVTPTMVYTGEVVQVESDGGILMKLAIGEIKVFKSDIRRVAVRRPAALDAAAEALRAGKAQEAIATLKPIVDRYAGLPTQWAQEALLQLGEAYQAAKDYAAADRVFDRFVRLYPDAPAARAMVVKVARMQVEQKDYNTALAAVEKFLEPLLARETLTQEQETAVAEALIVRGDCLRGLNQPEKALDSYLLVVTIYDSSETMTAQAKYKAGEIFELMGNVKRARDTYEELLTSWPASEYAAAARKRLTELVKAQAP